MQLHTRHTTYDIWSTIYDRLIEFCLIFLIIFTPFAHGAVQPWSIFIFEVTAALMFLFWIFKILANGKFEFVRNPLILFFFLFILYVSLQFLFSQYPLTADRYTHFGSIYSWATKTELLKVISYTIIFLVALNTIKTRRQITRILSVIIAVGFLMSIFFLMRYFGAKAPRGIINPDHFSGYLGMIIPLALGLLFISSLTAIRYTLTAKRFLLFFCVIVMGTALFFTMSRGGMFSFIAALLFMAGLLLTRKPIKRKGWILSAVAIFIILTIAWLGATPVVERILSIKVEIASRYFGGRLPIWQGTIDIIKNYPVFGPGLGTFNYIFPKYQPSKIITKHYTYAHSDFLELLSEVGIIGFSIFLFGLIAFATYGFRRFRERHDPYVIGMTIGIFGSLAGIFVHSFADFNLHIPANAILVTIILSLFLLILNYKQDGIFSFRNTQYSIRNTRFVLYPITVLLVSIFIVASARPAIADYYFQNTKSRQGTLSPYRGVLVKPRGPRASTGAPTWLYAPRDSMSEIQNTKLAIKLDPSNAAYHYQLGKLYSKRYTIYDIRHTIDEYKKAVELNPTNSKYHQSLAWAYGILAYLNKRNTIYAIRTTNLAHEHFQEAIRLEPNNPYRYRAYAIWLFNHPSEGNIEKGVVEYKKASELNPKLAKEAEKYMSKYKNKLELTTLTDGNY